MTTSTFDATHSSIVARNEVIRAALQFLAAERGDEAGAYYDADMGLAEERLALAARQLVDATNALPADQQPVGWTS